VKYLLVTTFNYSVLTAVVLASGCFALSSPCCQPHKGVPDLWST